MASSRRASNSARQSRTTTRSSRISVSSAKSVSKSGVPRTRKPAGRQVASRSKATAKRGTPSLLFRRYLPAVIVVGIVAAAAFFYPVLRPLYSAQREVTQLRAEYDAIQKRNAVLRGEVDRLKTPAGVEELARANLGFVRDGENAYVVMPEDDGGAKKSSGKDSTAKKTTSKGAPVKQSDARGSASSEATAASPAKQQTAIGDVPVWRLVFDAVFGSGH